MKVVTAYDGAGAVVRVEGRLDAEWSGHLAETLDDLLRAGTRSAVVDLSLVTYISSAGTSVLTRCAQDFAALRGELFVAAPPPAVQEALVLAGLDDRVLLPSGEGAERRLRFTGIFEAPRRYTQDWKAPSTTVAHGRYEVSPHDPGATLRCAVLGDPALVARGGGFAAGDCRSVAFPDGTFGLGVGAIGDAFEECQPRFGELLAAGGVVTYLPTDGARVPDYLATLRGHVPNALLGTGLTFAGGFSQLVRFGAVAAASQVPMSEIAGVCLDAAGGERAGVVMVAEVAGIVGAWLRRSPAIPGGTGSFEPSALREWLGLTAGPAHAGTTALVVGAVVAGTAAPPLASHLRPLRGEPARLAHLHAAVFPYRPVPQRTVAMESVVASLWEHGAPRAVLHLLHDGRHDASAAESHFVRGLAWLAPVAEVEEAR
jgi:anti-anti-sigma factor